ncbi:MAG: heterodisulfide reductase-related iron-sulfur binding cluster, partial [Gemmatimonadota bacterium]|nr:heterodisulfide reductase-related iron-sulfur binding cluster [Gemmatimonadota bacterium]
EHDMTAENVAFLAIVIVSAGFFALNAQRLAGYLRLGRAEGGGRSDHAAQRLWNVLRIGVGQTKILRDPVAGMSHALVFWGFVVLTAGTGEVIAQGIFPRFSFERALPGPLYDLFAFSQDAFGLFVLAAVGYLFYRRLVIKPRRLQGDDIEHFDALFILSMIAVLMLTMFVSNGALLANQPDAYPASKFVSHGVGSALAWMSPEAARATYRVTWWAHALLILFFLNYLPYSKHLHVITSLPNTFFSNTSGPGQVGVMRAMDLEAEGAEQFGAADVEHLSWKNLLDGYSCTECGRCTAVCPANLTGKVLSPRKIVVNVRQRLMEKAPTVTGDRMDFARGHLAHGKLAHGEGGGGDAGSASMTAMLENRLLDNYITEDELWACTSCLACVYECPVSIDQLDVINELRRSLVLMESRFPVEVQPVFESMERNGSPWAFNPSDRAAWAEGMDIPTMAELGERGERPEVLFWVGCMGSFDDRAKKIAVAFARVLAAAGVRFAILGQEETCNGDPARRLGNEYLYQMLARQTIETLDRYGVRTVVTFCPHCFHQIGNEYPQLGGHYEVIHHSTYIERLLAEGRVPLSTEDGKRMTIAYHDSCYLGRYNDVYDAPREALRRSLPVVNLVEPKRTRDRGLCCGAGGGRMFMEETVGTRINVERTQELLETGADALATACPFCLTMITDGVNAKAPGVPVWDISEVVASRLASS